MKIKRHSVKSCCGTITLVLKIDRSIDQVLLNYLISIGFQELPHFTASGLLYADSSELTVTGPFGATTLQVKCKKQDCDGKLNEFEGLLLKLE